MWLSNKNMRSCLICGSKKVVSLEGVREYWQCLGCKVAWRKKFPHAVYKSDYYKPASSFASILFRPILNFLYFWRAQYSNKKPINLWVDVGAGDGRFISGVGSKRKIGVEGSRAAREIMRQKGIGVLSDSDFLKKRNLRADVISFWHVLEHLKDPKKFILAARKNLKTKSELIIAVPNIDSFEFIFFKRDWFHLEPTLHYWHFSPKSLGILLKKCGFKVEKIDYFSIEHHPTGLLQSFINKTSLQKNSLHRLVKSVRQKGSPRLGMHDILLNIFWVTLGLPTAFTFWIAASLSKKSGTFVVVAIKVRR